MKNIVVLFFLLNLSVFGQTKFTIYFDTDLHELNTSELRRLDDFLRNKELKIIKIVGFCDSRASNDYNDKLSKKRAVFVRNLIEKSTNQTSIELISKGENFQQDPNLAMNRKVEIYYEDIVFETKEIEQGTTLGNQVAKAKIGDRLILKNLYFYNRSGIFVPESKPVLEELLTILKRNPSLKIEIHGHICCQEGTDLEDTARIRALAVYNYLINKGIAVKRLGFKSFGSTKPIHKIPERNEDERNENRRVEIQIVAIDN